MVALIKALQVILALSILILFHELGHYTFAKIFRIRVEKFFLFFDAGGAFLFSTKRSKWFVRLCPRALDWETEYGIGWLPLGGYCKIAGMVDESMDREQLAQTPKPWEFRSHGPWQRLLVMGGGVLYNFIFAILAFVAIAGIWGDSYVPVRGSQVYPSQLAVELGFRPGDEILAFDDWQPENFGMLQADLVRRGVREATVLRDGDTLRLYIDQRYTKDMLNADMMFDLAVPFVVDSVAGVNTALQRGDHVVAFDGTPVQFLQDARPVLAGLAGSLVDAAVVRGADTLAVPVQVDSAGRIGVYMQTPRPVVRRYNFWQAFPAGWRLTGEMLRGYLQDLRLLATPSSGAYKSVGSFIAIGQIFPAVWDWYRFLYILGMLSIMLAVMNLLPIPALDGGHILFTLFEIITGRKPSDKFMMAAQWVGMILLLALMVLAFGNDIARLIH